MMVPLAGKKALVTGASRGIGRAIALELASLGADVAVTARRLDGDTGVQGTVDALIARGVQAFGIAADLARPDDVRRLIDEATTTLGQVDILVNNAAYLGPSTYEALDVMPETAWRDQLEVNLNAPFTLIKALSPAMAERGSGLIVNMSAGITALQPVPHALPGEGGLGVGYVTTKAAIDRFTNAVANELYAAGVAVVSLNPGATLTEAYTKIGEELGFDLTITHPMEVPAKVVGFLAAAERPLNYSGQVLTARDFAIEHGLCGPDGKPLPPAIR